MVLRPVHTSKFKRIRCASNANWSRSHCALSDAHQLNAHSMQIKSIHFKMWIQCASNRIAWVIPEVMNNELIHALERWLLGRRHDLTIFRSSLSWLLAVFLDHKCSLVPRLSLQDFKLCGGVQKAGAANESWYPLFSIIERKHVLYVLTPTVLLL